MARDNSCTFPVPGLRMRLSLVRFSFTCCASTFSRVTAKLPSLHLVLCSARCPTFLLPEALPAQRLSVGQCPRSRPASPSSTDKFQLYLRFLLQRSACVCTVVCDTCSRWLIVAATSWSSTHRTHNAERQHVSSPLATHQTQTCGPTCPCHGERPANPRAALQPLMKIAPTQANSPDCWPSAEVVPTLAEHLLRGFAFQEWWRRSRLGLGQCSQEILCSHILFWCVLSLEPLLWCDLRLSLACRYPAMWTPTLCQRPLDFPKQWQSVGYDFSPPAF